MWPFSSNLYQRPLHSLRAHYDYIVVGGGTGGCTLARRLAEDQTSTVLLIEKGDAADSWLHTNPLLSSHHFSDGKHSIVFDSATDDRFGRAFPLICGLGLGGTTRINGCLYTCGVPAQYNEWSQRGHTGWSYADIKPYLNKSEHWTGPVPSEYHGLNGPLQVTSYDEYFFDCSRKAVDAIKRVGFEPILDLHSPHEPGIGFNKMQYTIDSEGRRSSAYRAYLPREVVRKYENLDICTKTIARKLEFSEGSDGRVRAQGVELQGAKGGPTRIITARCEIVLACGALRTPQLLMLSGVGPQEHLREMGIRVIKHHPGVGQHLQDHLLIHTTYNCPIADSLWAFARRPAILFREIFNYVRKGTGWFLATIVELEIFGRSSLIQEDGRLRPLVEEQKDPYDPKNMPDIAVMIASISDPRDPGVDKSKGTLGINAGLLMAKSTGTLKLDSLDPNANPVCDMRYLSAPEDNLAFRAALRVTVAIAKELRASGYPLDDACVPDISNNTSLDKFIQDRIETMYHYTSTCRMAPEDDEHPGVVDDRLRVYGILGLRIADGSVFPDVPAAHPQALIYAIAEKCVDMIRQDAGAA